MAKGGGSWKVAYADFVTAMMAFFMVMWIGSQDQKIKQSVANYFIDPSGVAKNPAKAGAVFNNVSNGSVPDAEKAALGRGRDSYTDPNQHSRSTKLVGEWMVNDPKVAPYWREQALAARKQAAQLPEVIDRKQTLEEAATKILARAMRDAVAKDIPTQTKGILQDLLYTSIVDVNWQQLANDLIRATNS
jgi:chemotaxis protein MotB